MCGMMSDLEFYIFEDELWCMFPDGSNKPITDKETVLVKDILERIRECYPEAYKALMECYSRSSQNIPYFQFLMVNRFCKCNFGELDNTSRDIDKKGGFNFERVRCPMRGECRYEGVICCPQFNCCISDAEMRVMQLVYEGFNNEDIAERLYLSPHTVKNHIKSVYLKLDIHEKSEFIQYAHKNNLFKE